MQKSKCGVKVLSTRGHSWTTRRGARRLVERGLAVEVSGKLIQMVETDHRYACEPLSAHGPSFDVVDAPAPRHSPKLLIPIGFLPYPQPGAFRRRPGSGIVVQ